MKTITSAKSSLEFVIIAFSFLKKLKIRSQNLLKIILSIFLLSNCVVNAQIMTPFQVRYSENIKGDVTIIANNMISRDSIADYNGGDDNHDFSDNVYVDIDNDSSTFNSSSAVLVNPEPNLACLQIRKVLLYWAAADFEPDTSDPNSENQPNWNFNDIKLMLPGETNYSTLTADDVIFRGRDTHFGNDPYVCVKDITNLVNGLTTPFGTYQIANVEAKTGGLWSHHNRNAGTSGGWQIAFVYESPLLPARNISLFDGYAHITLNTNNYDINFNGFQTAPFGQVKADVVIGALEGDRDLYQDRLQIIDASNNYVDLSTPLRDANNFFNSRITVDGSEFLNRIPASTNTLGFDASVFPLNNTNNSIIANNQTSTTIRLTSDQETYGLYLLGLSVEIWEPDITPIYLTYNSINNATQTPDEILNFNLNFSNTGNDNVRNLSLTTVLPNQVSFVSADNLPAGVTYTYDALTNTLVFNCADGIVDVGDPALDIPFNLQVKSECYFLEQNCDLSFDFQFTATYTGDQNPTIKTDYSSASNNLCMPNSPVTATVIQPYIDWAVPNHSLDRVLECNDIAGLNDALQLEPTTTKCVTITNKTVGLFVSDPNCPNSGTYTNTWSFGGACVNPIPDYVQVITIQDTTPPSFVEVLPTDITVACDNIPVAAILTATDNCGTADVSYNETILNGSCVSNYTIVRTWTATDACGLTTTHTQNITVQDITPPTFVESLPGDITVECDSIPVAPILTATDSCSSASVAFTETTNNGSCPSNYVLIRTWTATDECGLTTTHTQNITVQDTTPPIFVESLPGDITVECDSIPNAPLLTATDSCGSASVTFNEITTNGNCPSNYFLIRTWTATDECGLTTTHTQTITVQDITPPTLITNLQTDITLVCESEPEVPTVEFVDNCSSNVTVNFTEQINTIDENDYQIVRTWIATDDCNNSTTFTQTIEMLSYEQTTHDKLVLCIDEPILDLNSLIDTSNNGTWSSDSMSVLNGTEFDPVIVPIGDYTFTYTSLINQCTIINEIEINLNDDCIEYPCIKSLFDVDISKLVTPNGDLDNETFNVAYILNDKIDDIETCDIRIVVSIFNRWGTKVFESENYNNEWSGDNPSLTVGGEDKLPTGTYYYVVKLIDSGLKPIQGFIYLGTEQ
ncbi:gliding motility-associated C-terminal domain-containing protein [Yeosuana marina]|uniref:gliding motility-associated C-terminal domain-containing protein n=1 Tax=Yeosuana marina TaxID=1565536 RepID=UPI0030ECC8B8